MNLTNFRKIPNNELYKYEGGFAILPWVLGGLIGMIAIKLFDTSKGSVKINGLGDAKWDDGKIKNNKEIITKIIYYPY